ncbi:MAG TPA: response regulator transcription factor [Streptosporangiaceae bacterium]|nr:response regulator transcription factor [Streptosporangiaceae bacterium]
MVRPITVVVADDQRVIRDGLVTMLAAMAGISVVGTAQDGSEAVSLARQADADVVLMDLRMPGTDGIEATRRLRASRPDTAVVALTTYVDEDLILAALQAGAIGYLTKNARPADIRRAIEAAAAGQTVLAPEVHARLLTAATRQPPPGQHLPDGLSPREGEILALVAEGLSNIEIAARAYIGESTVKTHINRIFAKTGSRNRAQAIAYAHRHHITRPREPGQPDRT